MAYGAATAGLSDFMHMCRDRLDFYILSMKTYFLTGLYKSSRQIIHGCLNTHRVRFDLVVPVLRP